MTDRFDLSACVDLFDNVGPETYKHISNSIRRFYGRVPQCALVFLMVRQHWVTSAECCLAVIAHHYHSHCGDAERKVWRDAFCRAEREESVSQAALDVWRRYQLFVRLYDPTAFDSSIGVTMRDFLQSKHYTAADVLLLQHVGLVEQQPVATVGHWFDENLVREIHDASQQLRFSVMSITLQHTDEPCLTEWRSFDNLTYGNNIQARGHHSSVENVDWAWTVCAVDVCVRRLGRTLFDTLSDYRFQFSDLFEIDGSLNMFLLRLHTLPLRRRLYKRAQQLTVVLQQKLQCGLVVQVIISAVLCMEHRYAATVLCDDAPCAFRDLLQRCNLPFCVPLMFPNKIITSPLQPHHVTIYHQSTDRRCDALDEYVDSEATVYRRYVVTDDRNDTEVPILLFQPFQTCPAFPAQPQRLQVQCDASITVLCASCLLFSLPCDVLFDRFDLCLPNRFQRRTSWTASELFVDRCGGRAWYALSLKSLTSHRDALTYNRETTSTDDPLCFVCCDGSADVQMTFHMSQSNAVDFNSCLKMYLRSFNIHRYSNGVSGLLFTTSS